MTGPKSELRIIPTVVRWTPTEITSVTERAEACRIPVARFVRECALGAMPRTARNYDQKALIRELAKSGNNLNQLAHEAHARDLFPALERIQTALALHMAALRQLVDEPEK